MRSGRVSEVPAEAGGEPGVALGQGRGRGRQLERQAGEGPAVGGEALEVLLGREPVLPPILRGWPRAQLLSYTSPEPVQGLHAAKAGLTTSPALGWRVVWEQEKPKRWDPPVSRLMSVPLPTPEGPHTTRAQGRLTGVTASASRAPWD